MANKQIIDLVAGTPVVADVLEFQVAAGGAGSSKKSTLTAIKTLMSASPSLVTPDLGTPSAGNLVNCTGFPVGGLTGTATGVLTFLTSPSSANLAAVVTDETGNGALVFATNPTLVTPNLGVPSAVDLSNATMLSLLARVVSGTTDTIVATDRGAEVIYTTGSSCAVTLPNAVSFFADGFSFWAKNAGAGTVTIVPTTATIDGAGSFVLPAGMSGLIVSKGGAYYVNYGKQGASGGGGITIGTTTITSGTSTRLLFDNAGVVGETSGVTTSGTALTIAGGTLTSSAPALSLTQTWNNGATAFTGVNIDITNTASGGTSSFVNWKESGTSAYTFRVSGFAIAGGSGGGEWGTNQFGDGSGSWGPCIGLSSFGIATGGGIILSSGNMIAWSDSSSSLAGSRDFGLSRVSAQVMGLFGVSTAGAAIELTEMTAPSAGATNTVRLYAEDNGAGKTRLMARFPTGSAVQIAIEP